MGKGRFINQKLGKNVSRKAGLLKSELGVQKGRDLSARPLSLGAAKKEVSPAKD
jgi:hypothetical protein